MRRLLSLDSDCAADSTCEDADPVSLAPCWTWVMLELTSVVPSAACWMLRDISCVAAPCCSTAAAIVDAVKVTLDKTPPELAADIMERGIVVTGGGSQLIGIDNAIQAETGMPVHRAKHPLYSVVLGSGQCLENFDVLKQVLSTGPQG